MPGFKYADLMYGWIICYTR